MITIKLKSWTVEYDPETTRNYYKSYRFITDGCSCLFCRNYVEAIRTLPQGILDFFDRFGIDPRKEAKYLNITKMRMERTCMVDFIISLEGY